MKILVYGTLREGQFNYDRIVDAFGKNSLVKVDEVDLKGYDMYDLGFYPAVYPGTGTIRCEMMEATPPAARFIRDMELSSGYEEVMIGDARLYTYKTPIIHLPKMATGDWIREYT